MNNLKTLLMCVIVTTVSLLSARTICAGDKPDMPESWLNFHRGTQNSCKEVINYLKEFKDFKIELGEGTIELRDHNYQKKEDRNGCKVSVTGPYSKKWEENPNVGQYFQKNGWTPVGEYMADGPDGGQSGFHKFSTFCLENHLAEGGGLNGPPPSQIEIDVICVKGHKRVLIE